MGVSANRQLASFVASAAPPSAALEAAKRAYEDTLGVMLAGTQERSARLVRTLVFEESPDGPARIVGTTQRASASGAALANGTAAHALDFDDVSFVELGHPSAPLVAATLAVGELTHADGRTLLAAYCVGFEIDIVLGRAMNPSHYGRGWHCTSTIGTIGAAAAAARVLGLDTDQTARALALAASLASGLKGNFGTMAKPLHAGLAARNGVQAARLASRGFTASDAALDGAQGFLFAFDAEKRDLHPFVADLGRQWAISETAPTVKIYPSCVATHPIVDALLDLKQRVGFAPEDVVSIDVGVDELTPTLLAYDRPQSGLEGKFSLHYCAAAAVIDGRIDLETFGDAAVRRADVQAFLPRITMRVELHVAATAPRLTQVALTVRLCDGRELSETVVGARGQPGRPLGAADLATKFRMCAERVLSPSAIDHAFKVLQRFEELDDVSALTALLVADASGA